MFERRGDFIAMFRTLTHSVNPHFNKQSQFELFPVSGPGQRQTEPSKQRFFLKSLTLSLETVVVLGIVAVMGLVVSYSIGIEKGKTQMRTAASRSPKKATQKPQAIAHPASKSQPDKVKSPAPGVIPVLTDTPVTASVKPSQPLILERPQDMAVLVAKDLEKFYTIQVASFKELKFAEQEASLLKRKGYDILVVPKGVHSIVCVGKFSRKEQAKTFSQKLKKQYKDCLVRSM